MRIDRFLQILCGMSLAVGWAGCTHEEEVAVEPVTYSDAAISFSTGLSVVETRASEGSIGSVKDLQTYGFGVLGYLTDTKPWEALTTTGTGEEKTRLMGTEEGYPIPDFMYNQPVMWDYLYVEKDEDGNPLKDAEGNVLEHYDWVYSPPKYWPNSSNNADPRYISFFAYAPYAADIEGAKTGVVDITNAEDKTPHLVYRRDDKGNSVDLLWAACPNATRNGNGLIEVVKTEADGKTTTTRTYQKVPLQFRHALAAVEIFVRRNYDEEKNSGKKPSTERQTKLFVRKLTLDAGTSAQGAIIRQGRLNLETGEWTGTKWNDETKEWEWNESEGDESDYIARIGGTYTLTYTDAVMNDTVSTTKDVEKWGREDYGVDEEERRLFPYDRPLIFFPQRELTFTATLSYDMLLRDNDLLLSAEEDTEGNKYTRTQNTITGNSQKLTFEAGKKYRLLVSIGVEQVVFELVSVEDWDFPMRVEPTVTPYVDPYDKGSGEGGVSTTVAEKGDE